MGVTIGTYEAYCRKKGYPKPTVERLKNIHERGINGDFENHVLGQVES